MTLIGPNKACCSSYVPHGAHVAPSSVTFSNYCIICLKITGALLFTQVVPRLNPCFFPDADYISQDRQRLLLRLDMYALQERQVTGDGNCQVRYQLQFAAIVIEVGYDVQCKLGFLCIIDCSWRPSIMGGCTTSALVRLSKQTSEVFCVCELKSLSLQCTACFLRCSHQTRLHTPDRSPCTLFLLH